MKNFIINSTLVGFILSAVALSIATPASAQNYPEFEGSYVIDQADIIPAEQEAVLNKKLIDYKVKTLNEVAVVTVTSLEGQDIKTYTNTYFRKLGVGNKDANNGVMLLVAPNDRKVRIEVGYGLEPWLTDMKSSNIISDVILPEFKAGNMADGVLKGADAVMVAATPPTAEELAAAKKIAQADALRAKQTWDSVVEFMLMVLSICAAAAAMFGVYWVVTGPRRRAEARAQLEVNRVRAELAEERMHIARKEEQLRIQAAEKERQRHAAIELKRQQERDAHALKVRNDMLAAMSVSERNAFLNREREAKRIADEAAAAIRAQHAAEQLAERERQRQREREREAERAEERRRSSSSSYSSPSSSWGSSDSSSSSSDFGGGSSGGGGSDSSW